MDKCLFCDCDLTPGSEEHVFLAALGGRIATYRATCQPCNNSFASIDTGKVDDALAEGFKEIRNGLKIWSGRNNPPPTLLKAGVMPDGAEFDLAPGFVPIMRPGRLPAQFEVGEETQLIARDEADAAKILDILAKRGISAQAGKLVRVQQKTPTVHRSVSFDGPKVWRCVAKTAVVGFVVLYGNEQARHFISPDLRKAIRYGTSPIANFAGWDFTNEWPAINRIEAHSKTPSAQPSGFEHSLIIADVGQHSVAYITFFGSWRFSVLLGQATGLSVRGLAVNPRSTSPARFILDAQAPKAYTPKNANSFSSEHASVLKGSQLAFNRALQQWSDEAHAGYVEQLTDELTASISSAGEDDTAREAAISAFAEKLAVLELGEAWRTELATFFDEDSELSRSTTD